MTELNFKKFFRSDYTTLRISGSWIGPDHEKIPKWYQFYSFIAHTNTCIFVLSLTINCILKSTSIIGAASLGYIELTLIMGELKALLLLKNHNNAAILFELYGNKHFQIKDEGEMKLANEVLQFYHIIRTALKCGVWTCLVLLVGGPLVLGTMQDPILPAWFPFDVSNSPHYQIVYLHQSFALLCIATCNSHGEALLSSLCVFIRLQCDLLSTRLNKIGSNGTQHKKELLQCIKHQKYIFRYLNTTNEAFGIIYFWQFFATTLSMCMDLFLLSVLERGTYEYIFLLAYLLGIVNMLLVPCWFASEMTERSESIANAAYSCNWVDGSNLFKKDLSFFMCRSQKPLKLYGANFFEISVITFVAVCRASMSYFAVMRNLNAND